jgi:hypothetical protein
MKQARFTVVLSEMTPETVTVEYTTQDGTAIAPDFYEVKSGVLTFRPGETEKDIFIPIVDQSPATVDTQFSVLLTSPENANISDGEGVVSIPAYIKPSLEYPIIWQAIGENSSVEQTDWGFTVTGSASAPASTFGVGVGGMVEYPDLVAETPPNSVIEFQFNTLSGANFTWTLTEIGAGVAYLTVSSEDTSIIQLMYADGSGGIGRIEVPLTTVFALQFKPSTNSVLFYVDGNLLTSVAILSSITEYLPNMGTTNITAIDYGQPRNIDFTAKLTQLPDEFSYSYPDTATYESHPDIPEWIKVLDVDLGNEEILDTISYAGKVHYLVNKDSTKNRAPFKDTLNFGEENPITISIRSEAFTVDTARLTNFQKANNELFVSGENTYKLNGSIYEPVNGACTEHPYSLGSGTGTNDGGLLITASKFISEDDIRIVFLKLKNNSYTEVYVSDIDSTISSNFNFHVFGNKIYAVHNKFTGSQDNAYYAERFLVSNDNGDTWTKANSFDNGFNTSGFEFEVLGNIVGNGSYTAFVTTTDTSQLRASVFYTSDGLSWHRVAKFVYGIFCYGDYFYFPDTSYVYSTSDFVNWNGGEGVSPISGPPYPEYMGNSFTFIIGDTAYMTQTKDSDGELYLFKSTGISSSSWENNFLVWELVTNNSIIPKIPTPFGGEREFEPGRYKVLSDNRVILKEDAISPTHFISNTALDVWDEYTNINVFGEFTDSLTNNGDIISVGDSLYITAGIGLYAQNPNGDVSFPYDDFLRGSTTQFPVIIPYDTTGDRLLFCRTMNGINLFGTVSPDSSQVDKWELFYGPSELVNQGRLNCSHKLSDNTYLVLGGGRYIYDPSSKNVTILPELTGDLAGLNFNKTVQFDGRIYILTTNRKVVSCNLLGQDWQFEQLLWDLTEDSWGISDIGANDQVMWASTYSSPTNLAMKLPGESWVLSDYTYVPRRSQLNYSSDTQTFYATSGNLVVYANPDESE